MKRVFQFLALAIFIAVTAVAKDEIKTNYRTAIVMAYSPVNSVYEDDNLRLEIYGERLWVTNKTERTIFIDLSQCFLVHNGSSYPMYSKDIDDNHASKLKLSNSIDEFISIAPSVGSKQKSTFICNLSGCVGYGKYTTTESPSGNFTEYDERFLIILNEMVNESLEADPKGKKYLGTSHRHLTEDESINNIGANIAYAFNKKAEKWTPVVISTWVSDLYFAPYYVEMPKDLGKEDKRGFGVKKTEAAKIHVKADSPFEFEKDKSPIVVCDWTGEFDKGEFELRPTWVIKKEGTSVFKNLLGGLLGMATFGVGGEFLFKDPESILYKSALYFDGQNDNWGKMKYLKNFDLTKFEIKDNSF